LDWTEADHLIVFIGENGERLTQLGNWNINIGKPPYRALGNKDGSDWMG
jgi:hypothetical protein